MSKWWSGTFRIYSGQTVWFLLTTNQPGHGRQCISEKKIIKKKTATRQFQRENGSNRDGLAAATVNAFSWKWPYVTAIFAIKDVNQGTPFSLLFRLGFLIRFHINVFDLRIVACPLCCGSFLPRRLARYGHLKRLESYLHGTVPWRRIDTSRSGGVPVYHHHYIAPYVQ